MVYTIDLGSIAARHGGSSPLPGTIMVSFRLFKEAEPPDSDERKVLLYFDIPARSGIHTIIDGRKIEVDFNLSVHPARVTIMTDGFPELQSKKKKEEKKENFTTALIGLNGKGSIRIARGTVLEVDFRRFVRPSREAHATSVRRREDHIPRQR